MKLQASYLYIHKNIYIQVVMLSHKLSSRLIRWNIGVASRGWVVASAGEHFRSWDYIRAAVCHGVDVD